MAETKIQWTDHSINPIRASKQYLTGDGMGIDFVATGHYCEKISSGCAHCYASALQKRFQMPEFPGKPREPSTSVLEGGSIRIRGLDVWLDDSKLQEVLRRKKPTKYFWCDMSDMFGSWVPFEWIDRCFAIMAITPQHTHQVLTKRPDRMADYLNSVGLVNRSEGSKYRGGALAAWATAKLDRDSVSKLCDASEAGWWEGQRMPNVWLGTSIENQATADERIPHLLRCPARVRFLSCEPLLGPIDLDADWLWASECRWCAEQSPDWETNVVECRRCDGTGKSDETDIEWVIIGGESGRGARPCDLAWIRSIVNQCRAQRVPCFVKQLGANAFAWDALADGLGGVTGGGGDLPWPTEDRKGGNPSEWPEDLRVREFPEPLFAERKSP